MSNSTEIYDAIAAVNQAFMTHFNGGDAAGVASLYTENGQFLPPNSDFVSGRPAIQATFQTFMDMGIKGIKLETVELEGYGNTASEVGRYTLEGADGQTLDQGKFIVIWKLESGQWRLHRDIINSSMPSS